ncbi:putative carboxylesterase 2 [Acorus calamus]|uniref:Carboxylesterase 2 n=1 Tax=Acorus calamus TaxID=4465 RepID=A0AAV9FJV9_ACOCL|nr:putative carboxylesterase 2 [Acorus calamus]
MQSTPPKIQKTMASIPQEKEVAEDLSPFFLVYTDGTISRFGEDWVSPPSFDPVTGVTSKDVIISSDTGVSARLYLPKLPSPQTKLPLFIYFHGGAFCIGKASSTFYHQYLNYLVSEANVVAVSVDYRRPPEDPLPTAYDDAWDVIKRAVGSLDEWLSSHADFERVYLGGDSAGANIAYNMAMRAGARGGEVEDLRIEGLVLLHPCFWGTQRTESESEVPKFTAVIDRVWPFAHPTSVGNDDPLINPLGRGAPRVSTLGCARALVCVAGKDMLRDRARGYYEALGESGWEGEAEFFASEGEGHCFFLLGGESDSAKALMARIVSFINRR